MPTATTGATRRRPARVVAVKPLTPHDTGGLRRGTHWTASRSPPPPSTWLLFLPGRRAGHPEFGPDGIRFPDGRVRPAMRTFTPRRFDAATATLEVEFVLHGEGPASTWARRAAPGPGIAVAGPGGRMPLALGPGRWIVAGDESAIPAIATLLEALPASASAGCTWRWTTHSTRSPSRATPRWPPQLPRPPGHFGQTLAAACPRSTSPGWPGCGSPPAGDNGAQHPTGPAHRAGRGSVVPGDPGLLAPG